MLYIDNGPVAKSLLFCHAMEQLGIQISKHLPQGVDGRRTTARSRRNSHRLLGLFDTEVYIEFQGKKEGPFYSSQGPIPLHTYRRFKKTVQEKRLDKLSHSAKNVTSPRSALTENEEDQSLKLIKQAKLCESEDEISFVP